MTDRVRTTISLPSDVHDVFKRMAEAGGMSVSRCMGDWLTDTSEGAQLVALKMEEARRSPMTAMRELRSMGLGMIHEVDKLTDELREKSRTGAAGERSAPKRPEGGLPPSSNTGVLVPPTGGNSRSHRAKKL